MTLLNQHLQHLTQPSSRHVGVIGSGPGGGVIGGGPSNNVGVIGSHHHQQQQNQGLSQSSSHLMAYPQQQQSQPLNSSSLSLLNSSSQSSHPTPHPILGQGITLSSQIGGGGSSSSSSQGPSSSSIGQQQQQQSQLNNKEMALLMANEANMKANNDKDHYEAIKLYGMAIQLDSTDARFFLNRSYCYAQLELYQLALDDAEQAIRLEPKSGKCYFRRGQALVGLKKFIDAERSFQEVLKLDPECQETVKELVNVRLLSLQSLGFDAEKARMSAISHSSIEEAVSFLLSGKFQDGLTSNLNDQQPQQSVPNSAKGSTSSSSSMWTDRQSLTQSTSSHSIWDQMKHSSSLDSNSSSVNGGVQRNGSTDSWTESPSGLHSGISQQPPSNQRSVVDSLVALHNQQHLGSVSSGVKSAGGLDALDHHHHHSSNGLNSIFSSAPANASSVGSSTYSRTIERPNATTSSSSSSSAIDKSSSSSSTAQVNGGLQHHHQQQPTPNQLVTGNNAINSMIGSNTFGPRLISSSSGSSNSSNGFLNSNIHHQTSILSDQSSVFDGSCMGKQQQPPSLEQFNGFLGGQLVSAGAAAAATGMVVPQNSHGSIGSGRHPSGGSTGLFGSEPSISPSVSSDSSTSTTSLDYNHHHQPTQTVVGMANGVNNQQRPLNQLQQVMHQQGQQRMAGRDLVVNGSSGATVMATPPSHQAILAPGHQPQQKHPPPQPAPSVSAWGSSSGGGGTFADIVKKKGAPANAIGQQLQASQVQLQQQHLVNSVTSPSVTTSTMMAVSSSSGNPAGSTTHKLKSKKDGLSISGDDDSHDMNGGSVNGGSTSMNGMSNGSSSSSKRPTNIWGYNGLRVANVSTSCPKSTLVSMFSKFGKVKMIDRITNKNVENQVWVFYDNPNAPVEAISKYQSSVIAGVSVSDATPLKLYFAATDDQKDLKFSRPKQPQDNRGECYYWRTTNCFSRDACSLRHIPACKNIDAQVWMKMTRDSTSSGSSN